MYRGRTDGVLSPLRSSDELGPLTGNSPPYTLRDSETSSCSFIISFLVIFETNQTKKKQVHLDHLTKLTESGPLRIVLNDFFLTCTRFAFYEPWVSTGKVLVKIDLEINILPIHFIINIM